MSKLLAVAFAALSILAVSVPANAGSNCTTTCNTNLLGQQVCNTRCW